MFTHLNNGYETDLEPTEFYLSPNYPNPFMEKTKIKYCVAYTTRVQLTIYDSKGDEIQKLVDEEKNPGTYEVEFYVAQSAVADSPAKAIKTYYCRLEAGDYISKMKMELIK